MACHTLALLRSLAAMVLVLAMAVSRVDGLADTDTITWGGDNSRSGYFPNNNMDPAVVNSSEFGQIFKVQLPGNYNNEKERIFSQPLIYTPKGGDGTQYVYWATAQNNVYKMNAKTGEIVASRNLHIPFMSADLTGENQETPGYCQDINPVVGIIGTGVIDPDTDTLYLSSKTYANQNLIGIPQGRPAGRIYIHALNVNDLKERPNFPINLEGLQPRNNPSRLFNGGIQNQRPGLLHPKGSDFIYAGFGSHCVNYNFTGWVIGWHKTTGEIVERFATQGEGVDSPKKGASVWMSGGGIASDDRGSIFFSTGNGYSGQVKDIPIDGRSPPTSLEEAVVHMTYNTSGMTSVVDFFMPANKGYLDGGDLDLGTSPVAILPSDPFSCGDIKRMGVITGKDHTTWFLNLDDLGGYKNGPNRGNRVIGSYYNENSVYAGVGVYPLDGGYVYVNVIGFKSHVFKFNCVKGVPAFTKVADSPAGKNGFGVSHGAVTSYKNQPGTGLFWVTDVDNAIPEKWSFRIYEAVPSGSGGTVMKIVKGYDVPAINKFTRPQFGDGIVYFGTSVGLVYGFGAPTNPALNCSTVPDFGTSNIGVAATEQTVSCTAKGGLTITALTIESADFSVTGVPNLPVTLGAQDTFNFKANFKPTKVGTRSASIIIKTSNNIGGYAKTTSVRLQGTGESSDALLTVSPTTIAFNQLVLGTSPLSDQFVLTNDGKPVLNIQSVQYSTVSADGPFVSATETETGASVGPFSFSKFPSQLAAQSQQLVTVTFNPAATGNYTLYANIKSDGGSQIVTVTASVGASPVALIQLEKPDGSGWQTWTVNSTTPLSFGNVTQNTNRRLRFRITNTAPAGSVALQVPISKPPFGVPGLIKTVNQADLGEGSIIPAGEYLEAIILCAAPKTQWNTDSYTNVASWIFNTNDATLGKFEVPFTCTATAQQGGPLQANGQGSYRYVGCFRENNPGRQLKQQMYGNSNNTADMCLQACAAKGFTYCGMQYHRECWGGPTIPVQQVPEVNCNFDCSGDINQYCGGDGTGATAGNAHISLFATNTTLPSTPPPGGPYVNPGLNGYTSIGCYTEATSGRALPNAVSTNNVRTVAACINACSKLNYKYIGLEYGGECWCANDFRDGAVPTKIGDCSVTCRDNSTEYCGGGQRLNVYQRAVISDADFSISLSSTTSSSSATSTTSSTSSVSISTSDVSSESSSSSASSSSSSSLSSSSEVPISTPSSVLSTSSTSAAVTSDSSVSSTSSSVSSASLSSSSSASISSLQPSTSSSTSSSISSFTSSSSTSSSSLTTSSTSSSASPSSTVPAIKQIVGAYRYQGCYTENTQGGRSLTGKSYYNDTMTLEACATACNAFTYWGTEYGRECYCGNELRGNTDKDKDQTKCSFLCPGDKMTFCGAGSRLSLYKYDPSLNQTVVSTTSTTTASTSSSAPRSTSNEAALEESASSASSSTSVSASSTSTTTTLASSTSSLASSTDSISSTTTTTLSSTSTSSVVPSASVSPPLWPGNVNFTYYGCVVEPSNGRLLTRLMFGLNDMTHDKCLEACWMYDYAGIEYGRECWCGNGPINWKGVTGATAGSNTTDAECKMNCSGDAKRKCGASKKMTLFYYDIEKNSTKA